MSAAMVEARGLGKDYGETIAVAGLDLSIEEGVIYGLLGPNGAGKTTTISMMCGVITPSRGTARIAGHDIGTASHDARRAIGLVPQSLALYDELSARQNLAFFGGMYGLSGAELGERIEWVLGVAGLSDRSREPVERFSGGMKRRLNLGAGLLHQPAVLICDEPTVGVDPQSRKYIFDTLLELNHERGMTIVYTSHYMEEVASLCQRVAIMDHGRLVAEDTVDSLISSHASGALELEIEGDAGAALEAVKRAPGQDPERPAMLEGAIITVHPAGELAPIIAAVEGAGVRITALRSHQSDLETAFLGLTGHSLRDDE